MNTRTVCLARQRYGDKTLQLPIHVEIAMLECSFAEEGEEAVELELLEAEFFDDECVVIIYRLPSRDGM